MESNELMNLVSNLDEEKIQEFVSQSNSNYKIQADIHSIEFDYSWVDMIEETIPYLDNIVRTPKKFLAQEEEVVPVEKAKKISMETIKHLAQHTNLIQDVTEDGTITPSAVLNIHKEETFDLYENRFVFSLLNNLYMFIQQRKEAVKEGSFSKSQKKLNFNSQTKLTTEVINLDLNIDANSYEDLAAANGEGLDINTRINKIELIVLDFVKSPLMKSLVGALPVRSPIRKTNTILKNPNFKKALELWEFIERYDYKDKKEIKENLVIDSNKEIELKYILTSFMNYNILNSLSSKNEKDNKQDEKKSELYQLNKVIQDFMKDNKDINATEFKQILGKAFAMYKQKKIKIQKTIYNEFYKCIRRHNMNIRRAVKLLKK